MRKALVIEDSAEYQLLMTAALETSFDVTMATSAEDALAAFTKNDFDIVLIDVGLPGRDGLSLCAELRADARLAQTPILLVTGRNETQDVLEGFAAGADDFIRKPFHPLELLARVEARLKKSKAPDGIDLTVDSFVRGQLKFIIGQNRVVQTRNVGGDRDLGLTPNEYKILFELVRASGRTLSRGHILRGVWGEQLHVIERTVDKHICSLRRKMGDTATYVSSIPGEGYRFTVTALESSDESSDSSVASL